MDMIFIIALLLVIGPVLHILSLIFIDMCIVKLHNVIN
jgi:hypothetical protein